MNQRYPATTPETQVTQRTRPRCYIPDNVPNSSHPEVPQSYTILCQADTQTQTNGRGALKHILAPSERAKDLDNKGIAPPDRRCDDTVQADGQGAAAAL